MNEIKKKTSTDQVKMLTRREALKRLAQKAVPAALGVSAMTVLGSPNRASAWSYYYSFSYKSVAYHSYSSSYWSMKGY